MRIRIALVCFAVWGMSFSWTAAAVVDASVLLKDYLEAVNSGDVATEIALFSDHDNVVSVINSQIAVGLPAILRSLRIHDHGTLALRSMRGLNLGREAVLVFATLGRVRSDDELPDEDSVLLTLVVRKEGDEWLIVHQHITTVQSNNPLNLTGRPGTALACLSRYAFGVDDRRGAARLSRP